MAERSIAIVVALIDGVYHVQINSDEQDTDEVLTSLKEVNGYIANAVVLALSDE